MSKCAPHPEIRGFSLTDCSAAIFVGALVFGGIVTPLQMQAAEQDEDIALVLQRHVGDALSHEVEKWEALLQAQGEPRRPKAH